MSRIEFVAEVNDSNIAIPDKHRKHIHGQVRFIVFAADEQTEADIIDELITNPLVIPGFAPLSRDDANTRDG